MKKQAFNPYMPSWEYVPDGEPHVFGDRVYVYGSHDSFNGWVFCQGDYVCYSAPVTDLSDWRYEGVIYPKTSEEMNADGHMCLYAPDVTQGPDGRYYLYYVYDKVGFVSVAVCDTPAGKYKFYGHVHYQDGTRLGERKGDMPQFDPGVLTEGDRTYLYTGFCGNHMKDRIGAMATVLGPDMLTIKEEPVIIAPGDCYTDVSAPVETDCPYPQDSIENWKGYKNHAFFEAPSIRKIEDTYYFVFSSQVMHELCYATSKNPTSGFTYRYFSDESSPSYNEIAEILPAAATQREDDGSLTITMPYAFENDQIEQMRSNYEAALNDMLSWVPPNASQAAAAKAVHDWLVENCSYNYPASSSAPSEFGWAPWTAYGALVERKPVCQGYSLAFFAAMNRLGIPASYVTHKIDDTHGWNRVEIDGSWYNLDITFDDSNAYARDYFFLRSDNWWRNNPDFGGYHTDWTPAGQAGTDTRYDGNPSWTIYTGPSSAPTTATSFKLALADSGTVLQEALLACDEALDLALVQVVPADANKALATWSSEDPSIATIDKAGRLTSGQSPGRTTISCTLGDSVVSLPILVEAGDLNTHPIDFALQQTELAYSGKEQHPALETVLLHATTGDIILEEGIDYRLVWPSDCTTTGPKTLTITGIGAFTGSTTLNFRIIENDKTALRNAVNSAADPLSALSSSKNGTDIAKIDIWVPTQIAEQLRKAIATAQAVLSDPNQTVSQITAATQALQKASQEFEAAKKHGTKQATWERLWGPVALDTMQAIVAKTPYLGKVAIIATMNGHWDALSASSLAGAYHAPVLLTDSKVLSKQTQAELKRLGITQAFICGGTSAISTSVERQVRALNISTTRVEGDTAIETAQAIYERLGGDHSSTCVVATSTSYHDALAISPFSYATVAPVFLCNGANIDAPTLAKIREGRFSRIIIVGGPLAVSRNTQQQLERIAPVVRLQGQDAYLTSEAIANFEVNQAGFDATQIAISRGDGYWDALSGACLCGSRWMPLILADDISRAAINGYIKDHSSLISIGYVFGGNNAVSDATMNAAIKAAA